MIENYNDLVTLSEKYIQEFDIFCRTYELIGKVFADHIGLKCSSREIYDAQKSVFEFDSTFMYQSIISKRRISIIGLNNGITTVVGNLNYLELSDQKPDGSQKDYIDHLEIVPVGILYEDLIGDLQSKGVELKEIIKPHHTTYDIILSSGFIVKLSREMLIDKIKREEMI